MGGNTSTGQQRCQPKVAVNRITECRKSRAFRSYARGDGNSGAFGHDAWGRAVSAELSCKIQNSAKKPTEIMSRRREGLAGANPVTPLLVDPQRVRPQSGW